MCFFFNDTATTEIYTLSLHDALPISMKTRIVNTLGLLCLLLFSSFAHAQTLLVGKGGKQDRKSTRLNSSHQIISYAVFCLKKKSTARHRSSARGGPDAHARHRRQSRQ